MSKAHIAKNKDLRRRNRERLKKSAKRAVAVVKASFDETGKTIRTDCCNGIPSGIIASVYPLPTPFPILNDCFPAPMAFPPIPAAMPLEMNFCRPLVMDDSWNLPQVEAGEEAINKQAMQIQDTAGQETYDKDAELSDLLEIINSAGQKVSSVEEMESGVIRISVNELLRQAREKEPVLVR